MWTNRVLSRSQSVSTTTTIRRGTLPRFYHGSINSNSIIISIRKSITIRSNAGSITTFGDGGAATTSRSLDHRHHQQQQQHEYHDHQHDQHQHDHSQSFPFQSEFTRSTNLNNDNFFKFTSKNDKVHSSSSTGWIENPNPNYSFHIDLSIDIDKYFIEKQGSTEAAVEYINVLVSAANVVFEHEVDAHCECNIYIYTACPLFLSLSLYLYTCQYIALDTAHDMFPQKSRPKKH
mmetsp:Transcript_1589/g.2956  ORF Transcript_1589/g.2956 Transcript_1589/m.2956 type:complete len:233 (-) Transcript_1589:2585-3283(-)